MNGKDEQTLLFSSLNGEYRKADNDFDGYPKWVEHNKENGEPFIKTVPAKIIYCRSLTAWVLMHPNITKFNNTKDDEVRILSESDARWCLHPFNHTCACALVAKVNCEDSWLAKSTETKSYSLVESSQDVWDLWTGIVLPGTSISVTCNECNSESDCNYNGPCKEKKCDCYESHFGQQCQFKTPCDVLVSKLSIRFCFESLCKIICVDNSCHPLLFHLQ